MATFRLIRKRYASLQMGVGLGELREQRGLTQLGIARLIGMTDKAVRQWETQTRQSTKGALGAIIRTS